MSIVAKFVQGRPQLASEAKLGGENASLFNE